MTHAAAVLGAGTWGTTFAKVLVDAGNDVTLWARRDRARRADQRASTATRTTCPTSTCRDELRGHARRRGRAAPAPSSSRSRSRPSRCGPTWSAGCRTCRRTPTLVSLMKGVELGTTKRMSEVIAEVTGAAAGSDRGRVRARTWRARSPLEQPTATRRRLRGRAPRPTAVQQPCATPLLPAVHEHRRRRLRARRRGQERHRARLRDRRTAWASATTPMASIITRGLAETARLGRAPRRRPD